MAESHRSLCPSCRFVRRVTNRRGSVFLLCRLSAGDPDLPKYPPQPRIDCRGYRPAEGEDEGEPERERDETG